MTKKIFAISLLLLVMIILSLMPINGSLSGGVKEEEVIEGKRQQEQQFAYAANNTNTTTASSSYSYFSSPLPSTTIFNFAAVGDWGCTDDTTNTIKNIQNKDPELVLALGDLSYENTGNCWLNETSSINNKLKIAIGNHDYDDDHKKVDATLLQTQYKKHFDLSNTYYSFDYYNVHFIAMDSILPYTINSPQYSFVRNDLISTSQNADIKWIIIYFHHPMYTSASEHSSDLLLRETYHPLFDQYGVDLVLQGHNHNYQRSYPITYNDDDNNNNYNKITNINNDDISSKPTITSANTNTYNNPTGEIYVTAGTGGESLYDFKNKADFIATQYKGYGFFNVDISSDGTKLTGTF
ncbi:MAG TPA: metallophosphoesterase, partial [Nitrososphaeraceae archaeon]|nr:metallophosphoesterase [Nitrososphaeraceae archaeon]